jgi:hypothetical protein
MIYENACGGDFLVQGNHRRLSDAHRAFGPGGPGASISYFFAGMRRRNGPSPHVRGTPHKGRATPVIWLSWRGGRGIEGGG